jgi:3-oxoacyl-[acyl-carrier protein] reductase
MSVAIDLTSKTALVTGASQGIGASIARTLHRAGAQVVINHPGVGATAADADAIAHELNSLRPNSALAFTADVGSQQAVSDMMNQVRDRLGGIDYLINNAAILRDRSIAKMSLDDWQSVIDINLTGVFLCTKLGLEIMRDGGAIVSMSSIAAIEGFFGQTNYAAAKAGVAAMMRVVSREAARRGIRANAIAPGVVETAMAQQIPESVRADMVTKIPLQRFGLTQEIADSVLFLCSPLASYITGQTLEVNGGWRG